MKNPISPELAAQLVDQADADRYSAGSNVKLRWRCPDDPRHVWEAAPNTRRRSPACPVCANKVILAGVNDLATTHPELTAELADPAVGATVGAGSHAKVIWRCLGSGNPSHIWQTSVVQRTRSGSGCPFCSGRTVTPNVNDLAALHPNLAAQLADPRQAIGVSPGSPKKLLWRCPDNDTHAPWEAPVRNRVGSTSKPPTGCPECSGHTGRSTRRNPTLGQINSPLLDTAVDPKKAARLSTGSGKIIEWLCAEHPDHPYRMSVNKRSHGQGCPICAGTAVAPGLNDLATTHPSIAAELVDQGLATTLSRGSTKSPEWECEHGHVWTAPVYSRVAGNGCPQCTPVGTSEGEQQLFTAIKAMYPDARHRARVHNPTGQGSTIEVDILAGDLAIEFNGLYWHSDAVNPDTHRHSRKLNMLRKGYRGLIVWEDQWMSPHARHLILRTIAHKLGRLDRLESAFAAIAIDELFTPELIAKHGARQLQPVRVNGADARAFLVDNHIQGPVALSRAYGLVDGDGSLLALLGLRSPSHNTRANRGPGVWEIQRYATRGHVMGGFGKLLTHATKDMLGDPDIDLRQWVTLSANDISDGGLYKSCGFEPQKELPPNYWYTGGPARNERASKERFQLKRFRDDDSLTYQEGWTEREAAQANKLLRIYDAGKTRWVKNI